MRWLFRPCLAMSWVLIEMKCMGMRASHPLAREQAAFTLRGERVQEWLIVILHAGVPNLQQHAAVVSTALVGRSIRDNCCRRSQLVTMHVPIAASREAHCHGWLVRAGCHGHASRVQHDSVSIGGCSRKGDAVGRQAHSLRRFPGRKDGMQ